MLKILKGIYKMSFGYYNTRTPYEVQRDNGGRFDFAKIKERYENTKPIQSKQRKHLDVRPIGQRDRSHERIVKVNDNEYYVTYDAYCRSEINHPDRKHQKAITYSLNGEMETITVHTPRTTWNKENPDRLFYKAFSSPSTFYFYTFNLPVGMDMYNWNSAKYVRLNTEQGFQHYTIEKGDITFTRKVGAQYWMPMVVHREVIHNLDRTKTKEWRERAKPLLDYLNIMVDMVDGKYLSYYINALAEATKTITSKEEVFKQPNDEAPEHWFELAEYYKKRIECVEYVGYGKPAIYSHDKSKLKTILYKDLYKLVKPLKAIEVPLGEPCKDRFKSWF